LDDIDEDAVEEAAGGLMERAIHNLVVSIDSIIYSFITACILCVSFMFLLAKCAKCLTYASIILVNLLVIFVALLILINDEIDNVGAIVAVVYLVLQDIFIWVKRKDLHKAIAIIDATGNFFMNTLRIFPIIVAFFLVEVVFVLYWLYIWVALFALGGVEYNEDTNMKEIKENPLFKPFFIFNDIVLIWCQLYIQHALVFVTMSCVSTYYFTSTK